MGPRGCPCPPSVGEAAPSSPSPDTIHIFHILKTNQAQTHSTCRGAGTAQPHAWPWVPQWDVTVSWGMRGLRPPPPALCIEGVRAQQSRGRTSSLSQEPGRRSIPAAGTLGWNGPAGPWKACGTPHTHRYQYQGDAQGAREDLDPTGWWVLPQSVGARLWACTHRQHGPQLWLTVRRGSAEQRWLWVRAWLSSPSHHRVLDLGAQAYPGSLAGRRHLHKAVPDMERPLL